MVSKENIDNLLKKYGQEHLLRYYDKLDETRQKNLLYQLEELDYSVLSFDEIKEEKGSISPIPVLTLSDIEENREEYEKIGIDAIKNNKVGAVLLAGGQGSRLGFSHPKGMFNIGIDRTLYIFECLINNLLEVVEKTGTYVPLFIMTSVDNDEETREFLKEHGYFGYDEDKIFFFTQEQLPVVGEDGKILMKSEDEALTAPNGNGGWFHSMIRAGITNILREYGIEWINIFAVDNVLQRIADPCFIGAVIKSGKSSGSKVVRKACPEENVGVMCLEDDKPSIIEYYEMDDEKRYMKDENGDYCYSYGVILNYLFNTSGLISIKTREMPIHRAYKNIGHIEETEGTVKRVESKAYKFETLVLDMIKMYDSCLPYEVDREREFAPVKNKEGNDSIATARELLKKNNIVI